MGAWVPVRPGDSFPPPGAISSKYRRCSVIGSLRFATQAVARLGPPPPGDDGPRISRAHAELAPDERGAGGECPQLAPRDLAAQPYHPAVGAREETLPRNERQDA